MTTTQDYLRSINLREGIEAVLFFYIPRKKETPSQMCRTIDAT